MSPKAKSDLAREHLEDAETAICEERMKDAVNALFYAGEAAIVAIAEIRGIDTKRQHGLKADTATRLHREGVLAEDYGPTLKALNQARKDIWYEGEEPQLQGDLEDLLATIVVLVEAAEASQ